MLETTLGPHHPDVAQVLDDLAAVSKAQVTLVGASRSALC